PFRLSLDAGERPKGGFGDDRVFRSRKALQQFADPSITGCFTVEIGIAQGDASVANQASPLGSLHSAAAKKAAELRFVHFRQPLESRQKQRFLGRFRSLLLSGLREALQAFRLSLGRRVLIERRGKSPRTEFFARGYGSPAVPGAYILANVATEHMAAHGLAQLLRNRAAQLDREIGDAAARIHDVWFHESLRGTCLDAAAAASAQVWRRQGAIFHSGGKIQRGENRSEKNPRTQALIQKQRILTQPAEACIFGENSLLQGSRVRVNASVEGLVKTLAESGHQLS